MTQKKQLRPSSAALDDYLRGNYNMTKDNSDSRARAWTFIVYPESAPENWRELLDALHIQWVESPLHDKDVNPDGTVKKAHWHILMLFEGRKSYKQILSITAKIKSPNPEKVASSKGLVRYMIHMDNPEKYQYAREDIVGHGGVDVESFFAMSASSRLAVLKEIMDYVQKNHVTSFADLSYHAIEVSDDWFDVVANHNTLFLNKLIDSEWQKSRNR